MTSLAIRIVAIALLLPLVAAAADPTTKRQVRVTRYGYPGDPHATRNTRLALGDHNNILNKDSVAVSPDLNAIFPYGSRVVINGSFLGLRHDTTNAKWRNTVAVYDPNGQWKEDFHAYIDATPKKK
jgi:3D (Asp-Asp-Asp) domain-containing protein